MEDRGAEALLPPQRCAGPSSRPPGGWQLPNRSSKRRVGTQRGQVLACLGFPASPGLVEETMLDSLAENLRLDYHRQDTDALRYQ